VTEKASRFKFLGMSSGELELGAFMALEGLALGVQGKLYRRRSDRVNRSASRGRLGQPRRVDQSRRAQYFLLERERRTAAARALSSIHVAA
jgi:hypothetical protein